MATLAQINAAIHAVEPCVTLYKGNGYLYYDFDNGVWAEGNYNPVGFLAGDALVIQTQSVMTPYLKDSAPERWIADGIAFGREVRARHDLPQVQPVATGDA